MSSGAGSQLFLPTYLAADTKDRLETTTANVPQIQYVLKHNARGHGVSEHTDLWNMRARTHIRAHSRPKLDLQCYKLMILSKTKCRIETN